MADNIKIDVARDFSDVPAGRYLTDGNFSGQYFRENWLSSPLLEGKKVIVVLDGAEGYGSSFLEEAFGGLVRNHDFSEEFLNSHLVIVAESSEFEVYKNLAERYVKEAFVRNAHEAA